MIFNSIPGLVVGLFACAVGLILILRLRGEMSRAVLVLMALGMFLLSLALGGTTMSWRQNRRSCDDPPFAQHAWRGVLGNGSIARIKPLGGCRRRINRAIRERATETGFSPQRCGGNWLFTKGILVSPGGPEIRGGDPILTT